MNIVELEKASGSKSKIQFAGKSAHILSALHVEFERQVLDIFKTNGVKTSIQKDFNKRNDELKKFRKVFDKLDNWSYEFRYPVQNDGLTKSFLPADSINLSSIIPVYKSTQVLLKYTTDVLSDPGNYESTTK